MNTYDVLAARAGAGRWLLAGAVSVNLDEGPGLVATQTLTFLSFLSADIEVCAAMGQWPGDVYPEVAAGYRQLIRAVLAAHVG